MKTYLLLLLATTLFITCNYACAYEYEQVVDQITGEVIIIVTDDGDYVTTMGTDQDEDN